MEGRKRRCHVKGKKTEEDRRRGWISTLEEEDGKEQPDKFSPPFRKQFQATADKDYNEAIRLQPGRGMTYHCRGIAHAAQDDYPKAINDYDRAIDFIQSPYNVKAHNDRGIAYAMQGNHDEAMVDFNKAIQLQPDYDAAYLNRGHVRVAQGDYARAIDDYKQYLELGGGARRGNQEEVEQRIRDLQAQLDGE